MEAYITWTLPDVIVIIRKKNIGRHTERRSELFDEHATLSEYKYNLFIKVIRHAGIKLKKMFEVPSSDTNIKE